VGEQQQDAFNSSCVTHEHEQTTTTTTTTCDAAAAAAATNCFFHCDCELLSDAPAPV
jgi:hypothetical protein